MTCSCVPFVSESLFFKNEQQRESITKNLGNSLECSYCEGFHNCRFQNRGGIFGITPMVCFTVRSSLFEYASIPIPFQALNMNLNCSSTASQTFFTLSVDLGAKATGVFIIKKSFDGEAVTESRRALTLTMSPNLFKFSMRERTAVRHRVRGYKRRSLVRRLAFLIIDRRLALAGLTLGEDQRRLMLSAVGGYLKRRGYNHLESDLDLDLEALSGLDSTVFHNFNGLALLFRPEADLGEEWGRLSQNADVISKMNSNLPTKKEFRNYLKTCFGKSSSYEARLYEDAFEIISNSAKALDNQLNLGHRHRRRYQQEILEDMKKDVRLSDVAVAFGGIEKLWRCLCNLSNLQLRALRWYFNTKEMKNGGRFDEKRLKNVLVRAFKYFHLEAGEERRRINSVISAFETSSDVIATLSELSPEETIPPYEDPNNRRPRVDHTLLLSPRSLMTLYSEKWMDWAEKFVEKDFELEAGLDEVLLHTDRDSRRSTPLPLRHYWSAYVLQRVLDRNSARDWFHLRRLCRDEDAPEVNQGRRYLTKLLGNEDAELFLKLAARYYKEVRTAKKGIWFEDEGGLLERSNLHPPQKKNILDILVGNVFGGDINVGRVVRNDLWNQRVSGRRTFKSCCRQIEETRKKYGNEFKLLYESYLNDCFRGSPRDRTDFELVRRLIDEVRHFLRGSASSLHVKDPERACNPFSLSQLFTLIEKGPAGFSSTGIAVHFENQWRMSGEPAQCCRLPADSVRPFDGMLRRILDKQADVLAQICYNELAFDEKLGRDIAFSIVVEQNKFAFSSSLEDLKKNGLRSTKWAEADKRQAECWACKDERILADAHGLCAYTGAPLGKDVEVDHIIPRSRTLLGLNTVFNSEANLICVSRVGNQRKGDRQYTLEDLSSVYLKKVFGTGDCGVVRQQIVQRINEMRKKGRLGYFERLDARDRNVVRHALYLEPDTPERNLVLKMLASVNKARINGTQLYFVQALIRKFRRLASPRLAEDGRKIRFNAFKASAQETSQIRSQLAMSNSAFEKEEVQGPASHSIDAMCAYAGLSASDSFCNCTGADQDLCNPIGSGALAGLHPGNCEVVELRSLPTERKSNPDSKRLFKETIYGEDFLRILRHENDLFVGFSLPNRCGEGGNALRVTGKNPERLVEVLRPFLVEKESGNGLRCYRVDKRRAFPFLARIMMSPERFEQKESEVLDALSSLHYVTQRMSVAKKLITQENRYVAENPLKEKAFLIKRALKNKGSSSKPPSLNDGGSRFV